MSRTILRVILLLASVCATATAVEAGVYWAASLPNHGDLGNSLIFANEGAAGPAFVSDASGVVATLAVPTGGMAEFTMANPLMESAITTNGVYKLDTGSLDGQAIHFANTQTAQATSGASALRELNDMGSAYLVQTYYTPLNSTTLPLPPQLGVPPISLTTFTPRTMTTVLATLPGPTMVWVTPSVDTLAGPTLPAMTAGMPYAYTLTPFQALHFLADGDLTGTMITASNTIAVFAGAPCAAVGDSACDHIEEQQVPLTGAGTSYVLCSTAPYRTGPGPHEYVRVTAAATGVTTLTVQPLGTTYTLANLGAWVQLDASTDLILTSTQPVIVAQYWANGLTDGDPAMVTPHSFPMLQQSHTMYAPPGWTSQRLNVAYWAGTPLTVDGVPVAASDTRAIGTSSYRCASPEITPGTHQVSGGAGISVSLFGVGDAVAYWYASFCEGVGTVPVVPPVTPPIGPGPILPPIQPVPPLPVDPPVADPVQPPAGEEDPAGDAPAPDTDRDGVSDEQDNCPLLANTRQTDVNRNGIGDVCEDEITLAEALSYAQERTLGDSDGDAIDDRTDNCPADVNSIQADLDLDRLGDACDPDADGDTILDVAPAGFISDVCPYAFDPQQLDTDHDGRGDVCDEDTVRVLAGQAGQDSPGENVQVQGERGAAGAPMFAGIGMLAAAAAFASLAMRRRNA